jgi:hypothetical protein
MTWQRSISAAIRSLRREEQSLKQRLAAIQGRISDLEGVSRRTGAGRAAPRRAGKRKLSEKGRLAISRAAKRRWAKYRAQKRKTGRGK